MRIPRHMRGDRQAFADAVTPRARENKPVVRRERAVAADVAPMKSGRCSLTRPVDGIDHTEPVLVEPMRPVFGVIMHPQARLWRAKEVDMVAQREEFAAKLVANFAKHVVEVGNISDGQEVARNSLGGVERRHHQFAVETHGSSRSRPARPFN